MRDTQRVRAASLALCVSALGCSATASPDDGSAGGSGANGHGSSGSGGSSDAGRGAGAGTGTGDAGSTGAGRGGAGSDAGTGGGSGGSGAGRGGSDGDAGAGGATGPGACSVGGASFPDGATGIPAPDGCNTCSCSDGELACTEIACPDDGCVVARRLDRCCAEYVAVTRAALAQDECLAAEPGPTPDQRRTQECFEQSPIDCTVVLCAPMEPPSRIAGPNGSGGCGFVDECQVDLDCTLGYDTRACCGCPESIPLAILDDDPCVIQPGTAPPAGASCPPCAAPVLCGMCEPPPDVPTCVVGDALNRCQ